ncbi:unnamed protein product [Cercopithifilaria johnstoni]|uniref:Uncharacterized protein n=1 Tax=Cercopithifilaria johnstoni TaxID=2874296 RepID=A0A8J2LYF9_9BILA|nr:unnamed protein product [Cercopithifilaria johnstoni]
MSKQQRSREGEQRDSEKSSKERGQSKMSRSAGRVVRPLSEVLFFDSFKSKERAINAQLTASTGPISLKDAITDCSLRFQHTTGRSGNDNSSRSHSYRKSRRRLEISSRADPPSSHSQRTRKSQNFGKSASGQLSREIMVSSQRSQLLDGNLHDRRFSRRTQEGDHNFYHQRPLLTRSVDELPQEGGTYVSLARHHTLTERGKVDDSTRSIYPNIIPALFGRPPPPPNIRDLPRAVFPLPGFGPGFGGIPPGFYLPPQAASGAGAPPGFYLPLQAVPGTGMPSGFMPHGFYPPPGFGAVPRFYPPPLLTAGSGAPLPLPQTPLGIGTSLGSLPRPQSILGTGAPFAFNPPSQTVLGSGTPPRFHPLSQPTFGTFPMLPTSQQGLSREKSDQIPVAPRSTIPPPQPAISNEIFGSMPSASTSTATTAIPPTLPTGSPPQQKIVQPRWFESDYGRDGISSRSDHYTTATNIPSIESFEFTPQFTLPIVRLFGGLFVHNCEESHYVTTDPMPLVI